MTNLLSQKQVEFICNANRPVNLAHGSVRCGKTIGTLFAFMELVKQCPDSLIWMIGHTSGTIFNNVIRLLLEPAPAGSPDPLKIFRPLCTWLKGDHKLLFMDKVITTSGANDAGSVGKIQGSTISLCYCDEMTLFPDSVIEMLSTRPSLPHSKIIASMNPSHPSHKLKTWIDKAIAGDQDYYQLHFTLDDNPFVAQNYKDRIKNSLAGVFYKRLYLGQWTNAEGAIFDFFDRDINVVSRPPRSADYWIVGIDYGTNNPFAAVLIGVHAGKQRQEPPILWVEDEYYWDHTKKGRQKTSSEFADDIKDWLEPYSVRSVYIDPSAANFRLDLQKRSIHPVNANNDVNDGIVQVIKYLKGDAKTGQIYILSKCKNLIREIESYVWDSKKAARGIDEPLKKDDHSVDALRYALNTHRVSRFDQEAHNQAHERYLRERYLRDGGQFR